VNERIKQLAEQAGDYVNEVYTPPVRSKTPGKIWEDGHVDWYTQFNEKFAELIVKECLSQVDKMDAILEDDKEKTGVAWVGLAIAKHFGVDA
jgi:hypothetical protein